jgi:hypothetical protein
MEFVGDADPPQPFGQKPHQGQAVLTARKTDQDVITVANHIVAVKGPAELSVYFFVCGTVGRQDLFVNRGFAGFLERLPFR